MKGIKNINDIGIRTIESELSAVAQLKSQITDDFGNTVEAILKTDGRVILTGIGKSAIIASKIVATMNSTGTPSVFMHAADAIHGDLGTIRKEDIIICLSNSGTTPEIKVLVPILRQRGNILVAMTGNLSSFLAQHADYTINTAVSHEACPNNLAPTSSTTAQLIMGDALAVALLECRGFTVNDYAKFHPGGALGKKLYLKVKDLYIQNERPSVLKDDSIKKVIVEISSKRLGATAVMDDGTLIGIITDGDIRRMLEKYTQIENITATDIMSKNPKTIEANTLVVDALSTMRKNNITQLLVTDGTKYVGVVHLHDILREGII
ncbi:MAG: KpsF/GutQ family sugar-phosphate isomerase [Bacteroidetes bacterium]|nr:KpsF/GutQ family sugar-phosphate isomerase [Bacteroidota bacterium]